MYHSLLEKIDNKTAVIGVVGLGYVGLPLAVEKALAGYKVIGFDIQESRCDLVNQGVNYIGDVVDEDLHNIVVSGFLQATTDYSRISEVDAVMICVPTPLDAHLQPDISYVESSSYSIANYMKANTLVVLESTTYPGTTREILLPIFESKGFTLGDDFFLAFSPERVDPGNKFYNTKNTPKVVGGMTERCGQLAANLYRHVLEGEIHQVSSPEIAEMEKILENTYRNVNIALVNEMAVLCEKMKIDIWEVIDAAKTKPYGFQAFYPGPGLGGHCIPIDPFYLTWKAKEFDFHAKVIESAAQVNEYMPEYTVTRMMRLLNKEKKAINGARVLLLGVAYKQDIDDLRESPALKVIEHLLEEGAEVSYSDQYIPEFNHKGHSFVSQVLTEKLLEEVDLVVITTKHSYFDYQMIVNHARLLFDTKNGTEQVKENRHKINRL